MTPDNLESKIQDILPEMWREVCDKGAKLRFRVSSGSMMPILSIGDVVKVIRVDPSAVRIGDIVAFQAGQNVLVHRIIAKKRSGSQLIFRHRGDTALSSGEFESQNLIGRVISIDKEGREIYLDTLWHTVNNTIVGWRQRLAESVDYRCHGIFRVAFHITLGPVWKLYRKLLLRCL